MIAQPCEAHLAPPDHPGDARTQKNGGAKLAPPSNLPRSVKNEPEDQNRCTMPIAPANWLRDEDGALFWPSPISAVALMMSPAPFEPSV